MKDQTSTAITEALILDKLGISNTDIAHRPRWSANAFCVAWMYNTNNILNPDEWEFLVKNSNHRNLDFADRSSLMIYLIYTHQNHLPDNLEKHLIENDFYIEKKLINNVPAYSLREEYKSMRVTQDIFNIIKNKLPALLEKHQILSEIHAPSKSPPSLKV